MMSIAQFTLAASFLFEGNMIEKWKRFFRNKPALIITGIILLHLIGMLWTTNYAEGWRDIKVKLPLLSLTVMIAGSEPLTKKQFRLVMGFFILAVLAGSLISMAVLEGVIHRPVIDIRDIFIFHISHIRFALFTCIAIFSLLYFLQDRTEKLSFVLKSLLFVVALWLFLFLFIMESITGIVISITVVILIILYKAFTAKKILLKITLIVVALLIPTSIYFIVKNISNEYYSAKDFAVDENARTKEGNPYMFDKSTSQRENGYLIWVYMNENEMRREWNKRSIYKYDSLDKRNQNVKFTLIPGFKGIKERCRICSKSFK